MSCVFRPSPVGAGSPQFPHNGTEVLLLSLGREVLQTMHDGHTYGETGMGHRLSSRELTDDVIGVGPLTLSLKHSAIPIEVMFTIDLTQLVSHLIYLKEYIE
jgi:hypothetical protein